MTNKNHTTLYTGVTSNLPKRVQQHKESHFPKSFTSRYNLYKLIYWEAFQEIGDAIAREKQIKAGPRQKKLDLINAMNPEWRTWLVTSKILWMFFEIASSLRSSQ